MKVVITDCDHDNIQIEKDIFSKTNILLDFISYTSEIDFIKKCYDADALIIQYARITQNILNSLPNLKLIVRYGVGVDTIDLEAATKHNVQVCNIPDYSINEVSNHAVALMLSLDRKIIYMNTLSKNSKWDYRYAIPINRTQNKTVGIIGLGRIGSNFAKKVNTLGYKILGYDPRFNKSAETNFIELTSFDELIRNSDIISLHIPADNNKNLFNKEIFKKMKKTSILINVSRGELINDYDLYDALVGKQIAGAAVDCCSVEPIPSTSPLLTLDNYILTPHMAWYSEESAKELKRKVAEECISFLLNKTIRYPINKIQIK